MTKTLKESMKSVGSLADMANVLKEQLGGGESGGSAAPPVQPKTEKEPEPDTTPIPASEGLTQAEIALIKPPTKEPEKEKEGKPSTIPGSPFLTPEAAVEAWKNEQRENQRLRDKLDEATGNLDSRVQSQVKKQLDDMLKELPPPPVSEEEKQLKQDDPEQWRLLQNEKALADQNKKIEQVLEKLDNLEQGAQAQSLDAQIHKVAADKEVPYELLLAYASIPNYANTPLEKVADKVLDMLKERGVKPPEKETGKETTPPAEVRSPTTGGATVVKTAEPLTVEDIGEPGSRKFREKAHKMMKQIFESRHAGGGAS